MSRIAALAQRPHHVSKAAGRAQARNTHPFFGAARRWCASLTRGIFPKWQPSELESSCRPREISEEVTSTLAALPECIQRPSCRRSISEHSKFRAVEDSLKPAGTISSATSVSIVRRSRGRDCLVAFDVCVCGDFEDGSTHASAHSRIAAAEHRRKVLELIGSNSACDYPFTPLHPPSPSILRLFYDNGSAVRGCNPHVGASGIENANFACISIGKIGKAIDTRRSLGGTQSRSIEVISTPKVAQPRARSATNGLSIFFRRKCCAVSITLRIDQFVRLF